MAITLDTIVNKVFKVVKNGYDNNEVESFLDEILEEMENREAETNKLKEQVAQLTAELNQARADLQKEQSSKPEIAAPIAVAPAPAQNDRHSSESFELVLSKAKGAYEEIVSAADTRAAEIINKANQDGGFHPFGCADKDCRSDCSTGRIAQANRRVLRFPQEDYRRTDYFHGADQASAVKTIQAGDNRPAFSV